MTSEQKNQIQSEIPNSEKDTAWKDVLDRYFPKMMEFFYPDLYAKIDWTRGYQSLDKELQKITRQAIVGQRFVDKLMQVYSLEGQAEIVLLHCEIQGQRQKSSNVYLIIFVYCGYIIKNRLLR